MYSYIPVTEFDFSKSVTGTQIPRREGDVKILLKFYMLYTSYFTFHDHNQKTKQNTTTTKLRNWNREKKKWYNSWRQTPARKSTVLASLGSANIVWKAVRPLLPSNLH
jgi:hypothetical protein